MNEATDFYTEGLCVFSATSVTVSPTSQRGREAFEAWFGAGVASVNIPKSRIDALLAEIEGRGMRYSESTT